jgi:hypothetical protein
LIFHITTPIILTVYDMTQYDANYLRYMSIVNSRMVD